MQRVILSLVVALSVFTTAFAKNPAEVWNLDLLRSVPEAEWSAWETSDAGDGARVEVRTVYYAGLPFEGNPTRVMAFVAKPSGDGPFPAMVLVHGGGGRAFKSWAVQWAKAGYAAIAMDLTGSEVDAQGVATRLASGAGPEMRDAAIFRNFEEADVPNMWPYHAVADVMLAHSLLAAQPYVDADRVGATGISWGGYLTSMVAGIDHRFKVVIPVYGCGNLSKNGPWAPVLESLNWPSFQRWNEFFDPIRYVGAAKCRVFFLNGTDDHFYPLDTHHDTYGRVKHADVRLQVHMAHGYGPGWSPQEIQAYADWALRDGPALPCLENMRWERQEDGTLRLTAHIKYTDEGAEAVKPVLRYSTDRGTVQFGKTIIRQWHDLPAQIEGENVVATVPKELAERSPLRAFFNVQDPRGNMVSSHYVLCRPEPRPNFEPVPDGATLLFGHGAQGRLVNRFLSKNGEASNWKVEDGTLVSTTGDGPNSIHSDLDFRDALIHVEFMLPEKGPGNSGLYIHGNYEMQVLNSYHDRDVHYYICGAMYRFYPPITQAVLPAGQWQSYDVTYTAPRRDASGQIAVPGRITAYLNGILVQQDAEFGEPVSMWHPFRHGTTPFLDAKYARQKATGFGPLFLQDHENPVRYRNVWVKPLGADNSP